MNEVPTEGEPTGNKKLLWVVVALGLVGLAIAGFILLKPTPDAVVIEELVATPTSIATPSPSPMPSPSLTVEPNPTAAPVATPEPEPTPSLPPLNASDEAVKSELSTLADGKKLVALVTDQEIIRKTVRAVYQLNKGNVVKQYRPIDSPQEKFYVDQRTPADEENLATYTSSAKNMARYAPFMQVVRNANPEAIARIYTLFSPLFEDAYQELGLGEGNFRQTLIQAIDLMLEAPEVSDQYVMVQPSVMYKFSNPQLEALPNAQKLMIRLGQENRQDVSTFLKELKQAL